MNLFIDIQLEDMINEWSEYYEKNGDSHYNDTPDWRIREIYWDKIVDRVIEDLDIELSDDEIDQLCDRLSNL